MRFLLRLLCISFVAVPLFASTVTSNYQKALLAYQNGWFDEALSAADKAVAQNPKDWKALEIRAYSLYLKMKSDQLDCYQTCLESLKIHPNNPPLRAFADRLESGEMPPQDQAEEPLPKELAGLPQPPDIEAPERAVQGEGTESLKAKANADALSTYSRNPSFTLGPLVSVPLSQNTSAQFSPGFGVEANLLFPMTEQKLLGADIGFLSCPLNQAYVATEFQNLYGASLPPSVSVTGNFTYIPIMLMGKYYLEDRPSASGPYVIGGIGLGVNLLSITVSAANSATLSTSEVDLLTALGIGVDFGAGFAQIRLDLDYTDGTNDTYTTSTGAVVGSGNLTGDRVTIFLPIQAGLRL